MKTGHTPSRSNAEYWDNVSIPWFTLADVWQLRDGRRTYLGDTSSKISELGLANSAAELLPPGTVVLSRTASVGFSGVMPIAMATSQDFWNWICGSLLLPEYLNYQFKAIAPDLRAMNMGSTHQTIYQRDAASIEILVPPLETQREIVDYLDRETGRIDALIYEQQQLIEMLRDRQQAVIEHAVYGGLETGDTRENDEPWLPRTPTHWPIVQLGFASDTLAGYAFPSDKFSPDQRHTRLLRGINIKPGRTDWTESVYWDQEGNPVQPEFALNEGDLVFGMDRPFVGGGIRVTTLTSRDIPSFLLQRVMRLRPTLESDGQYLQYILSTGAFLAYLEPLFTGVSVPHVSEWQVRKFKMPLPPMDEQRDIAAYCKEQTSRIGDLITEADKFVELSQERRAALITAAVTGQIDVREVA